MVTRRGLVAGPRELIESIVLSDSYKALLEGAGDEQRHENLRSLNDMFEQINRCRLAIPSAVLSRKDSFGTQHTRTRRRKSAASWVQDRLATNDVVAVVDRFTGTRLRACARRKNFFG